MGKTKTLKLTDITVDMDIQPRAKGSSPAVVEEYAEAVKGAAEFPPLVVYQDGDTYWLSEGFTRVAAYHKAGIEKAVCEVREGDRRKAIINACGSNTTHGQRRTNADKRRAVELVLKQYPRWSDRAVADAAAVSHTFVSEVRQVATVATSEPGQVATVATSNCENPEETAVSEPETRTGRDGKEYPVPTPEPESDTQSDADEEPEDAGPQVEILTATPEQTLQVVTAMIRNAKRLREQFSGLMAGAFAEEIRNALSSDPPLKPSFTGEMLTEVVWGTVHGGIKCYSCDALDGLFSLCGIIKATLSRVRSKSIEVAADSGDDPWDLGQELGGEQERIPI